MSAATPLQEPIYSAEDFSQVNPALVPQHIAIIPDGNRRWARNHSTTAQSGHREGADNLLEIIKAAKELGVKAVTFYTFSTENWNRSQEEVKALMYLLQIYLTEKRQAMLDNGIRFCTIGDLSRLPDEVKSTVQETKEITSNCQDMDMILALNYGARDEICRAVKTMMSDNIKHEEVTEDLISRYLDTHPWTDPELLIRTSGEMRLSNFLLWQASYTEVYLSDVFWPDFRPVHLLKAVINFQNRERRMGGP